jgi:hypothetical protein
MLGEIRVSVNSLALNPLFKEPAFLLASYDVLPEMPRITFKELISNWFWR